MTKAAEDFSVIAADLQDQVDELRRAIAAQQKQLDALQGR